MNFQPLHDRVVIEPAPVDEKTAGGIILPDTAKERPQQGTILAVGSGALSKDGIVVPLTVRVGQTVLYGKYSGTAIQIEGKDVLIMKESDILGVVAA